MMQLRLKNEADCLDLQHTELRSRSLQTSNAGSEPPTARAVSFSRLQSASRLPHWENPARQQCSFSQLLNDLSRGRSAVRICTPVTICVMSPISTETTSRTM